MHRSRIIAGLTAIALIVTASAAVAFSSSRVDPGPYKGNTQVGDPLKLKVVNKDGEQIVDEIVIDERPTGCDKTTIKKNADIKKGHFEVKEDGYKIGGLWRFEDSVQGSLTSTCKGEDGSRTHTWIATTN